MPLKTSYPKDKRLLWYRGVDRDKRSVTDICQKFGVSRKIYYKWKRRDFGLGGNTYNQY